LLWYIEGSKIYFFMLLIMNLLLIFLLINIFLLLQSCVFFKAKSLKLFGHFLNPYISVNLNDFELCVGPFASYYVVHSHP
jgi:hypothetical protein